MQVYLRDLVAGRTSPNVDETTRGLSWSATPDWSHVRGEARLRYPGQPVDLLAADDAGSERRPAELPRHRAGHLREVPAR